METKLCGWQPRCLDEFEASRQATGIRCSPLPTSTMSDDLPVLTTQKIEKWFKTILECFFTVFSRYGFL